MGRKEILRQQTLQREAFVCQNYLPCKNVSQTLPTDQLSFNGISLVFVDW